jgi:hypothetical protein
LAAVPILVGSVQGPFGRCIHLFCLPGSLPTCTLPLEGVNPWKTESSDSRTLANRYLYPPQHLLPIGIPVWDNGILAENQFQEFPAGLDMPRCRFNINCQVPICLSQVLEGLVYCLILSRCTLEHVISPGVFRRENHHICKD